MAYARVQVAEAPLVPDKVVEAWSEAVKELREAALAPGEVWDLLLGARAHLPLYVRVGSPKLETTDPAGGPFWSVGVRLGMSWVMRLG